MVNDFFVRLTFIIQSPWPASSLETQTSPLHLFFFYQAPTPPYARLFSSASTAGVRGRLKTLGDAPATSWPLLGHLLCRCHSLHSRSLAPVRISGISTTRRRPSVSPSVPNVDKDNHSGDRSSYRSFECAVICTGEKRLNLTELCFNY